MPLTLASAIEQIPALKRSSEAAFLVNQAAERILAFGKYRGLTDVLRLRVYADGIITLPAGFETALGASFEYGKVAFHDPWYEFVPRANWPIFPNPDFYPADLGDRHVTFCPIPDAPKPVFLHVEDPADNEVEVAITARTTDDEGVRGDLAVWVGTAGTEGLLFDGAPVYEVTSLRKERSTGHIGLRAHVSDAIYADVGRFGPKETEVRLRRYSIPGAKENGVVTVLAKRRFIPAVEPEDEIPVDSLYALRTAVEALFFEQEGDLKKATEYWAICKRGLSDALSESRGSAMRTVPIYCRAAAGSKLRAIR